MSIGTLSRRDLLLASAAAPAALAVGCQSSENKPASATAQANKIREASLVVPAQATTDGAGVRLRRALGGSALPLLDPFLMLDEFRSESADDYIRGFPDHPHRGFETVTYMLHGAMEHRDSLNNHGRLGPGSVQWMTAGRGIIHSEMPKQVSGLMWGYQLWVNLPAKLKMTKPRYQDIAPKAVPELDTGSARVRVLAGQLGGTVGPVKDIVTQPQMLDVQLKPGGNFRQDLPSSHNAFAFVVDGAVALGSSKRLVQRGRLAVLGPGDALSATSRGGGRMLLLAGKPIGEPVARRGPFVMNTEEELRRAFADYRSGKLVQG